MNILGVRVDNLSKKETLEKIAGFLAEEKFHQIATINPEFVLEAQRDKDFGKIINNCDLNIADGFGIRCAFWRYGKHLKYRLTGADLMKKLLHITSRKNLTVFLAAREDGLSSWQETRKSIEEIYPDLIIDGDDIDIKNEDYQILSSSCQIVFCNFGAPYQEAFLRRQKNDRIRLVMGVGGSFDYLTKKVRRAPYFWQFMGLEWLWRLFQRPDKNYPRRWKRIWRAVIIFPWKIIFSYKSCKK